MKEALRNIIDEAKVTGWTKGVSSKVRELLYSADGIPGVAVTINAGTIVHRMRMGTGYKSVLDLTYRKATSNSKMQRATLPGETAFYGCVVDKLGNMHMARLICLSECSGLAKAGKESAGREKATCSQWQLKSSIRVLSFVTDKTFIEQKDNALLNMLRKQYKDTKYRLTERQVAMTELINEEFTKEVGAGDNMEYLLTACLAHEAFYRLEEITGKPFDAIVYPSVQTKGNWGLDIVIRPDVADEKLTLIKSAIVGFYKNGDDSLLNVESVYNSAFYKIGGAQASEEDVAKQLHLASVKMLPVIKH